MCRVSWKSGNLNFLEPSEPLQACNGTALPLLLHLLKSLCVIVTVRCFAFFEGAVFENHREEWVSGLTLGAIHHSERRLSATHELSETFHLLHQCIACLVLCGVTSGSKRVLCCTVPFGYTQCREWMYGETFCFKNTQNGMIHLTNITKFLCPLIQWWWVMCLVFHLTIYHT